MNREQFIKYIADMAVKTPSDFFNSITIAQACLESGWGTSVLYKAFNNSFGYKAKKGEWNGKVAGDYKSDEEVNGVLIKDVPSDFRAYDSVLDSVKDHAYMMSRTPYYADYYKGAINAKTPEEQAKALTGKYAGDSSYNVKLMDIINAYGLKKYDDIKAMEEDKGEDKVMGHYIGLDIGHGANTWETGGGKGVSTGGKVYEEHTFNSIVAKKLKTLLEKSGHKVTYGVQQPMANDTGLSSRSSRFNSEKVDIMLSIHANWIGTFKNDTNGIGAFYSSYYAGTRTNNSKKLADAIMSQYRKQGQLVYGAGSIPSVLTNWTNFHMTRETTMPAVLMELGFMSGTTDFDKIFGSQQDKYTTQMAEGLANGINAYFGVAEVPSGSIPSTPSTGGGSGLDDVVWPAYKSPTQPFTQLKVGDKVTIRKGMSAWYIPNTPKAGKKPSKDFAGDTDVITKVIDVNVSYSKKAYLLKGKVSYILEQDTEQGRKGWTDNTEDIKTHTVLKGEYLHLIGEKYGVTVANIKDWNGLSSNVIFSGQKLLVEDPSKKSQEPTKPLPPTDVEEVPKDEQPKDEGVQTPAIELKDGEFMWEGIKYKIVKYD